MDDAINTQATRLLEDLAERFGMVIQPMTATFTDGGVGYSVMLRLAPGTVSLGYEHRVINFYNDDRFGPRWIGRAGRRVPAQKVIPYVTAVAEDPKIHSAMLNYQVLDRAWEES